MERSILIVDDCAAMRRVIRRILDMSGFAVGECYEAGDGEQALSVLRQHRVELILSDVNMPRLDGEGLVKQLTGDETLRGIPVIMITSDATQARADRLLGMGAKGYLVKPFQPAVLRDELERVMGCAQ
jgi:two-component system chemotaxis response regulator CheY